MGNGLHIVAQDLKCLRTSEISDYITYYDRPVPQLVAKAIMSVDMKKEYNSRNRISELDKCFTKDILKLFNDYGEK